MQNNAMIETKKLFFSFLLVCIVLSTPLLYLVNVSRQDYLNQFEFTNKEVLGLSVLETIFKSYGRQFQSSEILQNSELLKSINEDILIKNTFNFQDQKIFLEIRNIISKASLKSKEELALQFYTPLIRSIGNHSNLILDPDLDTYYLIDISVLRIPRILQLLASGAGVKDVEKILRQIDIELNEIEYSLKISIDYNFLNNKRTLINSEKMTNLLNELKAEVSDQIAFQKKSDSGKIVSLALALDNDSFIGLGQLLKNRNDYLRSHHIYVLEFTLGFWVLGILIAFILFNKILKSQSHAFEQINEERKKVEEAEKLSTLGELASGIIHEIKNPLTIIDYESNSIQKLIPQEMDGSVRILEKLKKINQMSGRINKISNIIAIYSRNAQNDPFALESLQEIISESIYLTNIKAVNSNVLISFDPTDLKLECRKFQLEQVLVNMINNSIDAILNLEEKWIKIHTKLVHDNGVDSIQIEVVDSGKGISEEVKSKIFKSFFTTKTAGKGTGLGLSISKRIITAHNGQLRIDSESPHTKFIIELPVHNK